MDPLQLFESWFSKEKTSNNFKLPAACCLSTLGIDGYPNSRFVSLKEIKNKSFVVTGPLSSQKGLEINNCSKASLSFWWTSTERQIRIQGDVSRISDDQADIYFDQRNRDSKIVSSTFNQGAEIKGIDQLQKLFSHQKKALENKNIERPKNWGGIYIKPVRIEFMDFKDSRLHERVLYQKVNNIWEKVILQP